METHPKLVQNPSAYFEEKNNKTFTHPQIKA
jgi:hypothetical protein